MGQAELIREMYTQKQMSTGEISKHMGIHKSSVVRSLRRQGIVLRSFSESQLILTKGRINDSAFEDPSDASTAYWAGLLAGDGNVYKSAIALSLSEQDYGHLVKFKEFLQAPNNITCAGIRGFAATSSNPAQTPMYRIRTKSVRLVDQLAKLNIVPNKTFTFEPPESLKHNRHFWRGMLDSDGHLGYTRDLAVLYLCGNNQVVSAFREYALMITDSKANVTRDDPIWRYQIAGKHAERVLLELYQDDDKYYLDRKRAKAYELTGRTIPN